MAEIEIRLPLPNKKVFGLEDASRAANDPWRSSARLLQRSLVPQKMKFRLEFGCATASGTLQMATEVCRLDYGDLTKRVTMTYFLNLKQIVESLEADETTRNDPIKRTFVIQGTHLTANVGLVKETVNALHTQSNHDEVLVIIEGGVRFRVGNETQLVSEGDLVFIPNGTLHGPELELGQKFSALSVFGPVFDPTQNNILWDRDSQG